ncbi:alpha/beta-hydrolase [Thozetella sp. PMI_491]|nr:alpha/beta-hydrolase [Thozetella sp. PMI_491]
MTGVSLARNCQNLTIPITVLARNGKFSLQPPANGLDVTDFVLDFYRAGVNYTDVLVQGYNTISGAYNISATYCTPDCGVGKVLQVMTHGLALDRHYWDLSYNNYNYSYVNRALARGYSTFTYDRLGIGESSHGDPINEVQAWAEIAALHSLTTLLRQGKVPGVHARFDKIFHIGHSYGSVQTYALSAMHPDDTDGIVLTGFSTEPTYLPWFGYASNFVPANTNEAFSAFPNGYLGVGSTAGFQSVAFAPQNFDPNLFSGASAISQPVAIGELLSLSGPISTPSGFRGPVLVITGERDLPFCGGNCFVSSPSLAAKVQQQFPKAAKFQSVIVPGTGHSLNFVSHSKAPNG